MTPRQHELLVFIRDRIAGTGVCPTYAEMVNATGGGSKSTVHGMVSALIRDGHLLRTKAGTERALRLPGVDLCTVPSEALIAELQRRGEEVARW